MIELNIITKQRKNIIKIKEKYEFYFYMLA